MRITFTVLWLAFVAFFTNAAADEESSRVKYAASDTRMESQSRVNGISAPSKVEQRTTHPEQSLPFKAEHPGDTALSQDEHGTWRFRSFPGLATLYVYDKDAPGKSNCTSPCTSAWAPLLASSTEKEAVGDWTLIARPDGRKQWAYKGRPVYLRYHNLPANVGDIDREGFRELEP